MWFLAWFLLCSQPDALKKCCVEEQYEKALVVAKFAKKNPEYYFWVSVAHFKLNHKAEASSQLKNVVTPMTPHNPPLAERYAVVASMMQDDLERWTDDDLDNTAREMDKVKRRLDKAMGGPETQAIQKKIIEDLDKKIKEAEDEMKKQNESAGAGQTKSQVPSGDSKIMEGAGAGEVENKKMIMTKDVWGKMPPKDKVKALEAVNRQLPPHIREAAEGFSRKINGGK